MKTNQNTRKLLGQLGSAMLFTGALAIAQPAVAQTPIPTPIPSDPLERWIAYPAPEEQQVEAIQAFYTARTDLVVREQAMHLSGLWVRLACLAQVQLWLARHLVDSLPPPRQRYLSVHRSACLTPRRVQRGFSRLISQIGSVAVPSKPRGISPRRPMGTRLTPRVDSLAREIHDEGVYSAN